MKIKRTKLLWFILFAWTVLVANTVYGQEGNRKYVYRDYDSKDTVFSGKVNDKINVMPARAAEKEMALFKYDLSPGFGGSGTCIEIIFRKLEQPPKWVGGVFPVEDGYWGEEPLKDSSKALDLSGARMLVFYAKGKEGGERIQVKAAIAGDKLYGDKISLIPSDVEKDEKKKDLIRSVPAPLPIISDWITLEKDWKRYDIQIENANQYRRVITPFAVIASLSYNPKGEITIYLDEIYYELEN